MSRLRPFATMPHCFHTREHPAWVEPQYPTMDRLTLDFCTRRNEVIDGHVLANAPEPVQAFFAEKPDPRFALVGHEISGVRFETPPPEASRKWP